MTFRLLPKDVRFFELFVADGENLQAAAGRLKEMIDVLRPARRARRRDPGAREARRRDRPGDLAAARGRVHHAVRPRGHPRADGPPRRRRRRHPGDRRDLRHLRHRREPTEEARQLAGILARAVRSASSRRCAGSTGSRASSRTSSRSTTSSTRPTRSRGPRSPSSSGTGRTRSRSSSGATSIARWRTPSTRPRTPPRPSSGCTTRRPSHRRAGGRSDGPTPHLPARPGPPGAGAVASQGTAYPALRGGLGFQGGRGSPSPSSSQRIAYASRTGPIGRRGRRRASGRADGRGTPRAPNEAASAAETGSAQADGGRLRRLRTKAGSAQAASVDGGAADVTQELQGVQRQRPRGVGAGAGAGAPSDGRSAPDGRRAMPIAARRRHATLAADRRRADERRSTCPHRRGRASTPAYPPRQRSRDRQAGRRNTYPTPRTVWMKAGCPGSVLDLRAQPVDVDIDGPRLARRSRSPTRARAAGRG